MTLLVFLSVRFLTSTGLPSLNVIACVELKTNDELDCAELTGKGHSEHE